MAGLPVVHSLGLVWPAPVLPALPATTTTDRLWLRSVVVVAGKAGKTGPGQTKPRLGTTGKPAKPKQLVWVLGPGAGRQPTFL